MVSISLLIDLEKYNLHRIFSVRLDEVRAGLNKSLVNSSIIYQYLPKSSFINTDVGLWEVIFFGGPLALVNIGLPSSARAA